MDVSHVSSLCLGNNRQHMPICPKTIISGKESLGIGKAYICLQVLHDVLQCEQLLKWADVSAAPKDLMIIEVQPCMRG